jgi:hypothetical protein
MLTKVAYWVRGASDRRPAHHPSDPEIGFFALRQLEPNEAVLTAPRAAPIRRMLSVLLGQGGHDLHILMNCLRIGKT